jgi:hypothetical protein
MRLAGRRLWCVVAYVYAFPGECVARSFEAAWISGLRSGALHGVQHFRPTKVCVGKMKVRLERMTSWSLVQSYLCNHHF